MSASSRVVDLSHPIHDGMPTYPGLPRPVVGLHVDHATSRPHYDDQVEFAIGRSSWSATPAPTWTARSTATRAVRA